MRTSAKPTISGEKTPKTISGDKTHKTISGEKTHKTIGGEKTTSGDTNSGGRVHRGDKVRGGKTSSSGGRFKQRWRDSDEVAISGEAISGEGENWPVGVSGDDEGENWPVGVSGDGECEVSHGFVWTSRR
jgi:hypothetical protein